VTKLLIVSLVLFPYFLYRFMTAFSKAGVSLERLAFTYTAVLIFWTLLLPSVPEDGEPRSVAFTAFIVAFLLHWMTFSLLAAIRLWRAGRRQPSIARKRMHLLAIGALGLALALIVTSFEGDSGGWIELSSQALACIAAIFFFAGLAPPAFLRLSWRQPELEELRRATVGLMQATSRDEVATNMLPPVTRIVGATAGCLLDRQGLVIGSYQTTPTQLAGLEEGSWSDEAEQPLRLSFPFGEMVVWTGPATPYFGSDEIELLRSLGALAELSLSRAAMLEQNQQVIARLQESDEMKNTFLSAISHELRTPLTSILGFALTLQRRPESMAQAQKDQALDLIVESAQKLEVLLADLLDLDRLTRGVVDLQAVRADVGELTRRVVNSLSLPARPVVEVEPAYADIDAGKLERIVENLVYNAFHHTPAGTHVWVKVEGDKDEVFLTVEDDGPGVPSELRQRIFEPFDRGAAPSHSPGTGIGLSLVSRFVALHHGQAWVEERPGGGASFKVRIPVAAV
jgi:signal transduction histidine kinase